MKDFGSELTELNSSIIFIIKCKLIVFFYFNTDILSFVSQMWKGNRSEIINGTNQCKVNLKHNKVVYLQTFVVILYMLNACEFERDIERERERERPSLLMCN